MQDLKITLVQADQRWENKEGNFENYEKLLAQTSSSDLIVLPEMFHTGFSMNSEQLGESMDDSPAIQWLKELAVSKESAVYTSLIIKDKGSFLNRGVFITPDGLIDIYDKRKSFALAGEDKVYTSGQKATIIDYLGWKINLQICYDLRFPEIVRNKIASDGKPNYDIILYVANWPERRNEHWKILLKARAIENQCFVVGVNRVGKDGKGLVYSGDSMLVDPLGITVHAEEKVEVVLTVPVSKMFLEEVRTNLPFLKDA
jgi:predicted amidohydrolase